MREKFVMVTLFFSCQHDVERYYLTWGKNLFTERSMVSSTMVLLYKGDKFVHRKNKYFVFQHTAEHALLFYMGEKIFTERILFYYVSKTQSSELISLSSVVQIKFCHIRSTYVSKTRFADTDPNPDLDSNPKSA